MASTLREILEHVAAGELTVEKACTDIATLGSGTEPDLAYASLDHTRMERCGIPEVVYGQHKTSDQIVAIMEKLHEKQGYAFGTRLSEEAVCALKDKWPDIKVNDVARTAVLGSLPEAEDVRPVLVIAAGTSDLTVAEEACESARFAGCPMEKLYDVGVAGIHRLFAGAGKLKQAGAIVVAAGMEGALPSVVGGLVDVPVVAVPTSVGYGASFGGLAALLGMLNSCASGVGVVNIDNGFGAGVLAARIILSGRRDKQ